MAVPPDVTPVVRVRGAALEPPSPLTPSSHLDATLPRVIVPVKTAPLVIGR